MGRPALALACALACLPACKVGSGPAPPETPPPALPPPDAPQPGPAAGPPPLVEARQQAARGAPDLVAPWQGPWRVQVWVAEPSDTGARALAAGLGVEPGRWEGGRPAAPAGTVAALWIPAHTDLSTLIPALAPAPGAAPGGAVVAVLGGGEAAWREEAAARLPWSAVGVLDPVGEATLLGEEGPLAPPVLGALAAARVAETWSLALRPLVLPPAAPPLPPGLAPALGPLDPAARGAPDPRTRAEVVRRHGPGDLAAALARDPDATVRLALSARSEDPALLAALAADPEPLVRARAVDRAVAAAAQAALADGSSVVRVVAADRLARLALDGDAAATAALGRAAASPDAYVRWKAAWGLARHPPARSTLEGLLTDPDADVRRQAARSLGALGDPSALPALIAALSDPNSFVRRWAAQALGALADPRAIEPLRRAAGEPTALVAAAAAQALTTLGQPTTAPPYLPPAPPNDAAGITRLAASPDATARKDLCKHLAGQVGHQALLLELAADADPEVRKSAVEALGWSTDAAGDLHAALLAALVDPDPDVVVTALDGLRRAGGGDGPTLRALLTHPDAELRLRAVEALAAAPDPDAQVSALLDRQARDPDERIRAAAVRADPRRMDPAEESLLVRHAAGAWPAGTELAAWARGVLAREDDLLHARFSWNDPTDRPAAYRALRPPVIRPYGRPDRG